MFWFSTKMGVKTLALQLCLFQILLKVHAEDPVDNPACIWKDPKTGDVYNLNPLANLQQDYPCTSPNTDPKHKFWLNICIPTIQQLCGPNVACCQQWDPNPPGGHASLGAANSIELSEALPGLVGDDGKGLTATFTRGTEDRQMVINFLCDKNSEVDGVPRFAQESPKHLYQFHWSTKHACPVSDKLSTGSILLIITACASVAYCVGGAVVNKFIRDKRGLMIVPNSDFWLSFPGLVKDGIRYTLYLITRNKAFYYEA